MDNKLDIVMDREAFESKEKTETLNEKLETDGCEDEVPQGCGCSISDIVQDSSWNRRFQYLTQGYEALPEWYGVPPGEISIEEQQSLLELEVERLKSASTYSAASLFHSNGRLGIIDSSELRKLSAISHQLLHHVSIIEIDNLCTILNTPRSPKIMRSATRALSSLYHKANRSCAQPEASFNPIPLEASERYDIYAKLIDYATSCVARLATRYATGDRWYKTNIAILGQIAVKLKFLARDASKHAEASLCHAKSVLLQLQKCDGEDPVDVLSFDEENILESCDDTFEDDYIRSSQARQKFAMAALKRALGSLNLSLSPWRSADFLQCSSEIYTVGLDKTVCAVTKDETSRVSVTSTEDYVNFCRIGLDLVRENFLSLEYPQKPKNLIPSGAEPVKVSSVWQAARDNSRYPLDLMVYNMDELLSLAVPLSLCSPQLGKLGEQLMTCLSLGTEPDAPPLRCVVLDSRRASLIACAIQVSGYSQNYIKTSAKDLDTFDSGSSSLRLSLKKHRSKLQNWKIDNNSVTIRCRWYVLRILILCVGVTLAFVVPPGVQTGDPMPNAYVASVVVGAILFVANNIWTSTWQWHDFLKGRIVCHSVSEIAKVTKVDEQLVLLKLLDHARVSRFATQGPYNLLFKRLDQNTDSDEEIEEEIKEKHSLTRALLLGAADFAPKNPVTDLFGDTDVFYGGFSIDRPFKLETLQASGFLVLQVAGYNGKHLVCLDARKEDSVDFMDRSGRVEVLSCLKPPAPKDGEAPTVRLSESRLEWARLLGVYTGDVVFE